MKKLIPILLMTSLIVAKPASGKPQRIPRSYVLYLEEDMNQIPIVMDESLYKMSCIEIKKNSVGKFNLDINLCTHWLPMPCIPEE